MLTTSSTKRPRNRVDISSKELARYWCKRLKKTKPEIEAAIAKVGDNAETVMKELGAKREGGLHVSASAQCRHVSIQTQADVIDNRTSD